MNFHAFGLALGIATAPLSAMAADYFLVGAPSNNAFYEFADLATVRVVGSHVQMWTTTVYGPKFFLANKAASDKTLSEYDCDSRENKTVETVYYSNSGYVIDPQTPPYFSPMRAVVPESIGDGELNFACDMEGARQKDLHVGEAPNLVPNIRALLFKSKATK